jgi:hypothetical protein
MPPVWRSRYMPLLFVLPVAFISHGTPLVLILGEKIKFVAVKMF